VELARHLAALQTLLDAERDEERARLAEARTRLSLAEREARGLAVADVEAVEEGALAGRALVADSIAAILSSLFGTSTVVSYIESASGVEAGGRTGLTTLTTAGCFLLALVATPLVLAVPAAATAPALVVVGVFMLQSAVEIDMGDFVTAAPAALTLMTIPLTGSIADGLGLGLLSAAVLALATGQPRRLTATGYVIAAVFFAEFFRIYPFSG